MSLRIRRLKLVVVTDQGDFGTDIPFPDGLVLLRADNTSGKSTCIKAIIYALGLERMFGPANQPPLTPAMTSLLEEGTEERNVIESQVFLEIENDRGQSLTISRQVVGSARDWRLVTVWEGPALTTPGQEQPGKDYYVRDPGSATRAAGFHTKLAEFIGWHLPEVMRYDGTDVPLYMECVLPLFYVEQRHGWSSIQATTPRFLQIREVDKKAIEFLLNLDACTRDIERQRLAQEESDTRKAWHSQREECELFANSYGGTVRNLPSEPVAKWPPEIFPLVELYRDNKPITVKQALQCDTDTLKRIEEEEIPNAQEAVSETESQLQEAYRSLVESELLEAEISYDIQFEENDLKGLDVRLEALNEDLKKNQDLERLRNYGATSHLHIATGTCPTCHQHITDSLLSQQQENVVMTVPENIEYIRSQIQTFDRMRTRVSASLKGKQRRLEAAQNRSVETRARIRVLKRTLVADGRIPSIAAVRERITLEERIERLTALEEKFIGKLGPFDELSLQWKDVQGRKKNLSADVLTSTDKRKVRELEKTFVALETIFGFDSFPTEKLSLSLDTYRPTREGFDVVYDVSASDNIRTICAYLIGLLELARSFQTNHTGLLILDEPRQQNLVWSHFTEVLKRAADAIKVHQQVIVATSDSIEGVEEIKRQTGCHCITISGKMLKRLPTPSAGAIAGG
jgi:hypothetical protein